MLTARELEHSHAGSMRSCQTDLVDRSVATGRPLAETFACKEDDRIGSAALSVAGAQWVVLVGHVPKVLWVRACWESLVDRVVASRNGTTIQASAEVEWPPLWTWPHTVKAPRGCDLPIQVVHAHILQAGSF